jgi:hypothetical protein
MNYLGRLRKRTIQTPKYFGKTKPISPTVSPSDIQKATTTEVVAVTTVLESKYKKLANLFVRYFWTYFAIGLDKIFTAGIKFENSNFWFFVNKGTENIYLKDLGPNIKETASKLFAILKDPNEIAKLNELFKQKQTEAILAPKGVPARKAPIGKTPIMTERMGKRRVTSYYSPEGPVGGPPTVDEAQVPFQSRDEITYSGELF